MNGNIERAGWFSESAGRTIVPVELEEKESVFVVLKKGRSLVNSVAKIRSEVGQMPRVRVAGKKSLTFNFREDGLYNLLLGSGEEVEVKVAGIPAPVAIEEAWDVTFEDPFGDSFTAELASLEDWAVSEDPRIRHFSGAAEYRTTFSVSSASLTEDLIATLSLGEVGVVATVELNGQELGTRWIAPYRFELGPSLHSGENELRVRVVNTWTNRLIGDESIERTDGYDRRTNDSMPNWYLNNEPLPEGGRKTFTTFDFYEKGDPLEPSGLMGPVALQFEKRILLDSN